MSLYLLVLYVLVLCVMSCTGKILLTIYVRGWAGGILGKYGEQKLFETEPDTYDLVSTYFASTSTSV